jgi:hypothetical protein
MERELQRQRTATAGGGGGGGCDNGIERARAALDDILTEADRILDTIRPVNAEEYLQQNRQRGGE